MLLSSDSVSPIAQRNCQSAQLVISCDGGPAGLTGGRLVGGLADSVASNVKLPYDFPQAKTLHLGVLRRFPERIASNQMLPIFVRIKAPADPATKCEITGRHRRKDLLQRIGGSDLSVYRAGLPLY